ncbi:conserved hypothetical protein [Ricinus communis]|uniref:Uncharacterized protein n=1 Tax=Ricinus communis TaxID=3988 RepID=B9SJS8_RICCO|nr:conserved hypothetical protein [Ricinus communis]
MKGVSPSIIGRKEKITRQGGIQEVPPKNEEGKYGSTSVEELYMLQYSWAWEPTGMQGALVREFSNLTMVVGMGF